MLEDGDPCPSAASRRPWRSTRSSRCSTGPQTQLPRLDPRAGHRDRQGPRRGLQRRDRQPAAVRGQRRRRAEVLDEEEPALRALVRNSGRTLEAVNERRGQLRQLIVNANDTFDALASRNESLAEAIVIFPTFLSESRATFRAAEDLRHRHPPAGARSPARDDRAASHAARRGQAGAGPREPVPRPRPADRRGAGHAALGRPLHPRRRAGVRARCRPTCASSTRSSPTSTSSSSRWPTSS